MSRDKATAAFGDVRLPLDVRLNCARIAGLSSLLETWDMIVAAINLHNLPITLQRRQRRWEGENLGLITGRV